MLNETKFVSEDWGIPVEKVVTRRSIPPQVLPGNQIDNVEVAAVATESALAAFLASNVIFNTVGIGAINMFWGLVNSLQLIAYIPLHSVILPANSKIAYELTYSIAAFDLVPVDPIIDFIQTLTEGLDRTSDHTLHCSETA